MLSSMVRLRPFNTSTRSGRARERYRRAVLTGLASGGARAIQILTTFISVPLTLGYLGLERFGLWVTISSLAALLTFADLGLGNGLMTGVAEADGKDDKELARRYVSSIFFTLCAIALVLLVGFLIASPWISWAQVFNVSSPRGVAEAGTAVAVFAGCFLVNLPLSVAARAQMGYQEGFASSLWVAVGNLIGLAGVLLAVALEAGVPWLVLAVVGGPAVGSLLNTVVLFGAQRSWLRPQWRYATANVARRMFKLGTLFVILQLASALAFQADNLVIAQIFGAEEVAQYSVPWRLFMLAPMILALALAPLWPAYGEAIVRRDREWVRATLSRSLTVSTVASVLPAGVLLVLGRDIIHLWAGPEVTPSFALLVGFGLWSILFSISVPIAMFLNGAGVIRFQVLAAVAMASANLFLSILLAHLVGLPGVIFGTVIAQFVFVLIPCALYVPRILASDPRLATH
jgi:O-antigen/teichoic acid export membrane protein